MGIPVYWSISSPVNPPKQLKPTLKRTRPLLSSILSRSSRQQQHSSLLTNAVPSYSDVVRRRNRVTPRHPSTSSSEQVTSPEDEARRVSEHWQRERIERGDAGERVGGGYLSRGWTGRETSRTSSSSGSTNVGEEGERNRYFDEDDIINYGDFIESGEDDVLRMEDLWSEPVVVPAEGMVDGEEEGEEDEEEEEDEDEQERVDEERIVSRFMTRHGWAWESDIDHHLRPV